MTTGKITIVEKWDKGKVVEVREVNIHYNKRQPNETIVDRHNVQR